MHGLLLVGHGSTEGQESAAPVVQHAQHIASLGLYDEVQVAFYKQEPRLKNAVDRFRSDHIVIVPVFLAAGYYTLQILPRELELQRKRRARVFYARAVGTHPRMSELVLTRAHSLAELAPAERRRSALIIAAHGTDRSQTSGVSAERVLHRLRRTSDFGLIACGYLDQEPRIEAVIQSVGVRNMVIVPFLLAAGWHTSRTVPERLGLSGPHTARAGHTIWYTPPVGTLPQVSHLILDLAREASPVERLQREQSVPA